MDLHAQVNQIVEDVQRLPPSDARNFIAIAGPPASGKSTLAEEVRKGVEALGTPCGLVAMDGFHLDNEILDARGLRARKGAPETFDVTGFSKLLAGLAQGDASGVPSFDRGADSVVPNAYNIGKDVRHIVVEGNYLFLDATGWRELQQFWTLRVFLAPPVEELRRRLIQRWLDNGLNQQAAEARATGNDLVNAETVLSHALVDEATLQLS